MRYFILEMQSGFNPLIILPFIWNMIFNVNHHKSNEEFNELMVRECSLLRLEKIENVTNSVRVVMVENKYLRGMKQ